MGKINILAIGDLHGKSCWQSIPFERYDKIIFLGDYVDGFDHSDQEILDNLQAVIDLKESLPQKVVLLLGNHDVQYLHYPHYGCSGFRSSMQPNLTEVFHRYRKLFQVAYQIDRYLFTHAGVSAGWLATFKASLEVTFREKELGDLKNMAALFNAVEETDHRDILHQVGLKRGGTKDYGGISWADREELCASPLMGFHQVVGHNPVHFIDVVRFDDHTSITFADVLRYQEDYLNLLIE